MKYFKTDGIRMDGNKLIYSLIPLKIGKIIGEDASKVCIGYDTRITSNEIFDLLVTGLVTRGCDVINLGICPTSMVGYITKKEKCDYGIMITASHNIYSDNGIKIFQADGNKLEINKQEEIDYLLGKKISFNYAERLGRVEDGKQFRNEYIDYLKKRIKKDTSLKLLIDCSNGVFSMLFDEIFKDSYKYTLINNNPNGKNINLFCGASNLNNLIESMKENSYDYGIAFDGDGDRFVVITRDFKILKGDDLLYMFYKNYHLNKIVTTRMSNLGLKEIIEKEDGKIFYANIGDQYVNRKMIETNTLIGGEESGHLIFLDEEVKDDGALNLIKFLNLKEKEFSFDHYYSENINLNISHKILKEKSFIEFYERINNQIINDGEVFIRPSGTEDVIRINIQVKRKELLKLMKDETLEFFNSHLL